MYKIFILPLLLFFAALTAKAQAPSATTDSVHIEIGDEVYIHSASNSTTIKIKEGSSLQKLLQGLGAEIPAVQAMPTDTPPPAGGGKSVTIKKIKTDSGTVVEIITKDNKGNVKKKVRIHEDYDDEFDEIFEDFDEYDEYDECDDDFFNKGLKMRRTRRNKNIETDWFALDIGLNGLLYKGKTNLPPALNALELDPLPSVHVNVGIFQQKINLYKHYIGFIYGVNYDNNDYRFSNNINFGVSTGGDSLLFQKTKTEGFDRNKLTTRFLSIPLALRFDFNPKKKGGGHITIGGQAGYRVGSFFKTVNFVNNNKEKNKAHNNYLLNNVRYGAFVKVGYRGFNIFADYIFTPLFREDVVAPKLNTFSFGLSLDGF